MTEKYERDLVSNILRKNKREVESEEEFNKEANGLLMLREE